MSKPFDYVTDASYDKKNLMRKTENDELAEKDYNPWLTNIAFSYHLDSILYANLMNIHSDIPKRAQYEFYLHGLRKKKRFAKWAKPTEDENLDLLQEVYNCNRNVAKQYIELLTLEDLNEIKEKIKMGGKE